MFSFLLSLSSRGPKKRVIYLFEIFFLISKFFEETCRGTSNDLIYFFEKKKPKGEFVIVVEGKR